MSSLNVSIVIPHFERFEFLRETVASVVRYARAGDQLTIVDDGSSPETVVRIEDLLTDVPNCIETQLICHKTNLGGAAARNTAVRRSRHDWLFCLDSDNLLTPNLLTSLCTAASQEALDVAVPEYTVFFEAHSKSITHSWRYPARPVEIQDHFSCSAIVPSASGNYLYSRDSWERARGYPDAAALDAWGFGLRQIGAGCTMQPVDDTFYLHRYGHASYWGSGKGKEMKKEADKLVSEQIELGNLKDLKFRKHRWQIRRTRLKLSVEQEIFPTLEMSQAKQGERVNRDKLPDWLIQGANRTFSEG